MQPREKGRGLGSGDEVGYVTMWTLTMSEIGRAVFHGSYNSLDCEGLAIGGLEDS